MYIIFEQITLILISASSLFFGFWVYVQDRKSKANQWFLLLSLSILGWVVSAYFASASLDTLESTALYRINFVAVSFFILSFYLFFSHYTNKKIHLWEKVILITLFFLSIISGLTSLIIKETIIEEWGSEIVWGELGLFYKIFAFVIALLILKNIYDYYISTSEKEKLKIQYFIIGVVLLAIGNIVFNIILPTVIGTVKYQHFGDFSTIFFLGFTAYAVVKRKLFEVKIVLTTLIIILIAILLSVDLYFTDTEWLRILKISTLVMFLLLGRSLIKSVVREIRQREELEKVSSKLAITNVRLEAAYVKLQELDKAKSEFLSIASHQLRTPLTAIKGYLSMISEGSYGEIPEKALEKMADVYESSERLIKLINDLLNVSRIETGKIDFIPKEEQVEDLISEIIKEMHIVADNKGIYLNFEEPKNPLPKVSIDHDKLRQVVLNIIDNALKYTNEGGITIKVEEQEDSILVSIADTGEGMTEEECSKMFQSFSRGSAGSMLHLQGAGLGLYVSKKFVEMHKGRVWVDSQGKGEGSTFFIELPVKK